jgi:hypothetical protein
VLRRLTPETKFNLLVYAEKVKRWRATAVPAGKANVGKAIRWAESALKRPRGETDAHAALERALLADPEVDTVYFLSDGMPTIGELTAPDALNVQVEVWNRERRIVLHTVALTLASLNVGIGRKSDTPYLRQMEKFMRGLADTTGGECRVVKSAPRNR